MDLYAAIDEFDGKDTTVLEELLQLIDLEAETAEQLLAIAEDGDRRLQSAATWVLRRMQVAGFDFTPSLTRALLELLLHAPGWEPRLHLLQMLPRLSLPAVRKVRLWETFRGWTSDPNKLVRAWSFNALAVLADQHTGLRPQARKLLLTPHEQQPPSVRARIRNILVEYDWVVPSQH